MPIPQPEFDRGMAALAPFVHAWGLSLNPEDIDEMVFAVLTHARSDASFEEIDAAVRQQLADYAFRQRRFQLEAYRKLSPAEAAVRALVGFLVERKFETVALATRGSRLTAEELRDAVSGHELVAPAQDWWSQVTVTPVTTGVGGGLHVAAPLQGDLTLELWLVERAPGVYEAAIENLHVL